MKAVILAAGKGTRMKEITQSIPKPMVLIKDKPMLEYIITYLKNAGITDFIIIVGYMQAVVRDYFKDGSSLGVNISYVEQKEQNGTGAAFHLAKDNISDEPFFFSFGDIIIPPNNYIEMLDFYKRSGCDVLLGLNTIDDPYRGAAVYIDNDNTITRMVEKPPKGESTTNLNNAGIMIFRSDVFNYTSKLKLSPRGEYELTDVFGMLREDGQVIKGYVLSGFWKDIGTPEDLDNINAQFM